VNAFRGGARLSAEAKADLRVGKPAASPHRRTMIAKIHVAKKQLNLIDDDYRQILFDETGKTSAGDMTDGELVTVLKRLEGSGFRATAARKGAKPADHPGAGKARALWISLHQLGAIDDPSEGALEAFARRQLGARLQWADQGKVYKLVEALKAMAQRAGWDQHLPGVADGDKVLVLKRRLVTAQLARLVASDWAPADWTLSRAVFAFGGMELPSLLAASLTELDSAARVLARPIADAKAAGQLK
jgi:phage gp16-like protein